MRRMWRRLPEAAMILTLGAVACSGKSDAAANAQQQPAGALPAGHPAVSTAQAFLSQPAVVAETMDAAEYTYARLTGPDGEDVWTAGPQTELNVGDTVKLVNAIVLTNFASKTLNRTFDRIYFTDRFAGPGEVAPAPSAAHTAPTSGATPSDAAPAVTRGVVEETMDAAGYTYLRVKAGDKDIWLAAPQMTVTKGATVEWAGAMTMTNFPSKTLNRTFDEILFVQSASVVPGS
ncbi:MAG: hypothetical protein LJF04_02550 [Gemmatimonadetes bacterium]|nr:hypothetical protein [Gemmatimonadota bacterium]